MPRPSLRAFALFSTRFEVPPSTERQNWRLEHPRRRQGSGLKVFAVGKLAEAPEGIVVARAGASGTALGTPAAPRPKLVRMQTPRSGPWEQAGVVPGKVPSGDGVHRTCALVLGACRCLPAPALLGGHGAKMVLRAHRLWAGHGGLEGRRGHGGRGMLGLVPLHGS